jgi:hypothetical protein
LALYNVLSQPVSYMDWDCFRVVSVVPQETGGFSLQRK